MSAFTKSKAWERSPNYSRFRRVVRLGAFDKWKRENPVEHARVEARFKVENETKKP